MYQFCPICTCKLHNLLSFFFLLSPPVLLFNVTLFFKEIELRNSYFCVPLPPKETTNKQQIKNKTTTTTNKNIEFQIHIFLTSSLIGSMNERMYSI